MTRRTGRLALALVAPLAVLVVTELGLRIAGARAKGPDAVASPVS